ncbi:eukaryotic-like serine/threonine-protein kinase [Frankia sp. Hr75.2]|nr:eukaryotic-like serine/threonine-protein kinase [Frankia sp. Hr75.2]
MADSAGPVGTADTGTADTGTEGPAGELDGKRRFGGRYRVDGELGRGGMSQVFYGYDERLDRPVAIKVLRQSPAGQVPTSPDSPENVEILDQLERDRKRFLREIRTTAQLEHPGIPAVYDTGSEKNPDGSPRLWLVMQLLRGSSLEALIDGTDYETEPLDLARAAAVAAQIAAVLADVHRVDIVHRDIKPANIMVVDGGLVKVLDFGIAILRGAGALPRLTQIDKTVGTPPYMSPEQHLGQVVTTASDIYSLGCLLFELLTGDRPFYDRPDNSLRAQHVQTASPPVRAHRSGIPPELGSLVADMLAKEPRERPTAEAVYNVLVPLVSGPSSAGAPGGPGGRDGRAHPADEPTGDGRDPTRPFRHPLLAPPRRRIPAARRPSAPAPDPALQRGRRPASRQRPRAPRQRPSRRGHQPRRGWRRTGSRGPCPRSGAPGDPRRHAVLRRRVQPRGPALRRGRARVPPVGPGAEPPLGPQLRLPRRYRLCAGRETRRGPPSAAVLRPARRPGGERR